MFTHQHHLRHLLRPEHYTSEGQYRAELRHLFLPAWHPVATVGDLARPGDFLTLDLLETPILLRNFDGQLRAFLNVCPHRHSQLAAEPRGNAERLRCRYHGWEFNADGSTGKIPDARAFRPWDRQNSCLTPFQLDTCGDLVFIKLTPGGPSLRDWVGPYWDIWQTHGGDYRHAGTWEKDFPCNWKIVLENSLESYHIPQVHPETFKDYPPEENAWHELDDRRTSFRTVEPREWGTVVEHWLSRRMGVEPVPEYMHRCLHPHATGSMMPAFRMMQCVFPTGPTTCKYRSIFFTLRGRRRGPVAWLAYRVLKSASLYVGKKVFAEDGSIYDGVQRGLAASPHRGVIGTREERLYHFQKYVLDNTRGARELPVKGEEYLTGSTG